jgi:hypothetical protein
MWQPLGSGVNGPDFSLHVNALATHDGDIVAAGYLSNAGGVPVNCIARWDGSAWFGLGAGVTVSESGQAKVFALAPHGDELVVGGYFSRAGNVAAGHIARWGLSCADADMNCDGYQNGTDVGAMVLALVDEGAYAATFPNCEITNADLNGDSVIDATDIPLFAERLVQ